MTEPHRARRRPAVRGLRRDLAIHGEGLGGSHRAGPPAVRAAVGRRAARFRLTPYLRCRTGRSTQPQYAPPPSQAAQQQAVPPAQSGEAAGDRSTRAGSAKLLAVAGVAVTLIGVVLLLVLAAQAGILRPEFRVAAGGGLAVALVASGVHGCTGGPADASVPSRWPPRASRRPTWTSSPSRPSTAGYPRRSAWSSPRSSAVAV